MVIDTIINSFFTDPADLADSRAFGSNFWYPGYFTCIISSLETR